MGSTSQGRGGRRGAQRRDHDRGGVPYLSADGGRITVVGTRVRGPWASWFACDPGSTISQDSSSESPSRRRQARELNFEALAMGYLLLWFLISAFVGEPLGRFQTSVGL